ncbi:Hypothetical predicted protein [Paramuricea clavata]|uniref:Uncharacterized protein n=1 Tax=Paramuricea clavata TaxID=317549 RepID=A0A7D9I5I2_PARCT|nr:Hypothetical predicted protein [Paramuricea clavata]
MRRVKLLSRIRCDISPLVAQSIYKTMIEPILLYCNNLFLGNKVSSIEKFQKKAFDTVDHGRLLSKLSHYGIKDKEQTWFENYLFGRRQRVIYDGTQSDSQPVVCGVPQGSILGPMLFILLINDIDHQLNSCKILLYADDTVVFTSSKNQETIKVNLNSDLSKLATWFYENNLVVNLKKGKTEFILSKAEKMDIMI